MPDFDFERSSDSLPSDLRDRKLACGPVTIGTAAAAAFDGWETAPDGTLSLDGQSKFPIYNAAGGLSMKWAQYKLVDGTIVETISDFPSEFIVKRSLT